MLGPQMPRSSRRTITTLGAPSGVSTLKGLGAVALRASTSVMGGRTGSGMGRMVQSSSCAATIVGITRTADKATIEWAYFLYMSNFPLQGSSLLGDDSI